MEKWTYGGFSKDGDSLGKYIYREEEINQGFNLVLYDITMCKSQFGFVRCIKIYTTIYDISMCKKRQSANDP